MAAASRRRCMTICQKHRTDFRKLPTVKSRHRLFQPHPETKVPMKRTFQIAITLLVITFALAACGGGGSSASTDKLTIVGSGN